MYGVVVYTDSNHINNKRGRVYTYTPITQEKDIHGVFQKNQWNENFKESLVLVNVKKLEKTRLKLEKSEYNGYHPKIDGMVKMDGKNYLAMLAKDNDYVKMDKDIHGGMPVLKGTRIQVSLILACLRDGMSIDEICEDYSLNARDVEQAINYAIKVLDYPFEEEPYEDFLG